MELKLVLPPFQYELHRMTCFDAGCGHRICRDQVDLSPEQNGCGSYAVNPIQQYGTCKSYFILEIVHLVLTRAAAVSHLVRQNIVIFSSFFLLPTKVRQISVRVTIAVSYYN